MVGDVQGEEPRQTVGGGLAHADPAEDLPAAILALDAEIKASGPDGERWIPASEFFITMLTTSLMPEELLTEIRVPARDGYKSSYQKVSRQAAGFAIVGVAACLKESGGGVCEDISVAVTGMTDVAFRAEKVEAALRPVRSSTTAPSRAPPRSSPTASTPSRTSTPRRPTGRIWRKCTWSGQFRRRGTGDAPACDLHLEPGDLLGTLRKSV